jgi:hypothetical protein
MSDRQYDDPWNYIDGLREDLGRAEERIRELEEKHDSDIRRLWTHISNMPGGV